MIRILSVIVTAGIMWTSPGPLCAGEETSPRAIIDKAVKAHGGEANLKKFPAYTMKGKGLFYGMGEGIPYTGTWAIQGIYQQNVLIEVKVADMTFKFQNVVNGDKGWIRLNDDKTAEMAKDELGEEREKMFARWVSSLAYLSDKAFDLALIGPAKVLDRPAVGVRVSRKGHRDVALYFDVKSGLLVKSETQVKDIMAGGEEYTQTIIFEQYKEIGGTLRATKVLIQKDGKRFVEAEMTEILPVEALDKSVFEKP